LSSPEGKESAQSPSLPIVIDSEAPDTPDTTPDMTAETDTGISNEDDYTSEDAPTFAIGEVEGNTPELYIDGDKVESVYDPIGQTLTPVDPLEDGSHVVSFTLTDPAGNESPESPALPFEIDSTSPDAPAGAPDMTPESDTGISNEDDITSETLVI